MIERLLLSPADGDRVDPGAIAAELPGLDVVIADARAGEAHGPARVAIDGARWLADAGTLRALDERIVAAAEAGPLHLHVRLPAGGDPTARALAVITRWQRLTPRPHDPPLDVALARHRALHDLSRPLVRADYDHALDALRWLLRLRPDAALALRLAALFHDVERLVSEPDERIEHRAPDYLAFKQEHARRGAALALRALDGADLPEPEVRRALALVAAHEQPGSDPDLALLNDADALSFFSLNSDGFLAYFGPAHARRKVLYTLRRLSVAGRARLDSIGLLPDVARLLAEARRVLREEDGGRLATAP